jgi:uncharacterized protein (TIGR02246 family)
MRPVQNVFVVVVLGLACLGAQASESTGTAQDCWLPAFKAGDADATANCYLADAVMWFPNGPVAVGREAIREGYAGYFKAFTIKSASLKEMGRSGSGNDITSWGTFEIVMMPKDGGAEVTERGRYTELSRRVDGRWMYVMDHASDDPPAAAGPTQ